MKAFITFRSEYSDDSQPSENDYGFDKVPHGRNILESYRKWLKENGHMSDGVNRCEEYGWEIRVCIDNEWIWQMIQQSDEFLMIADESSFRIPFINSREKNDQLKTALTLFRKFFRTGRKI